MWKSTAPETVTTNLTICDINKYALELGDDDSTHYTLPHLFQVKKMTTICIPANLISTIMQPIENFVQLILMLTMHLLSYFLHQAKNLKFHLSRMMRLIDLV